MQVLKNKAKEGKKVTLMCFSRQPNRVMRDKLMSEIDGIIKEVAALVG